MQRPSRRNRRTTTNIKQAKRKNRSRVEIRKQKTVCKSRLDDRVELEHEMVVQNVHQDEGAVATGNTFDLLSLPAELRNKIYESVLDDQSQVYLRPRNRANLSSQSALPRVSHQIRSEFTAVMYLYAPDIIASVKDFDFGHIITFLNRLSDLEMRDLLDVRSSRKMTVELSFSHRFSYSDYDKLARWINRLQHPNKRGTQIDASYLVVQSGHNLWNMQNYLESECGQTLRKVAAGQQILAAVRAGKLS